MVLMCSLFFVGCEKKEVATQTDNVNAVKNTQQTDNKESQEKKPVVEKEVDNSTQDSKKESVGKNISAIYYKNNQSIVFDKVLDSTKIQDYAKAQSLSFNDNTPLNINYKNNQILSIEKKDEISALGTYVGLSDNKTAEFSYNNKVYRITINEEQLNKLEEVGSDILLKLNLTQDSKKKELILKDFSK